MNRNKSIRFQLAADDVGVIAETVDTLRKLLDRFNAEHGSYLYGELQTAFPGYADIDQSAVDKLYKFERSLTPPDDGDEARQAWRRMGGHT